MTGPPEGSTIEFELYETKKGEPAVCDETTLTQTLSMVDGPLVGGFYSPDKPLEVVSDTIKNTVDFDKTFYFVEVTRNADGVEISRGDCGDASETVEVRKRVAAAAVNPTGGNLLGPIVGGAGLLALMGAGALLVIRNRRKISAE